MATKATLLIVLKDLASKGLVTVASKMDKLRANVEKAGPVFGGVAAGIGLIGTAALVASGKMEQWTVAFTTMLGDADKAKVLLNDIKDFAAETPFDLPQVIEGSKRLLAFGFAADEITDQFRVLGNIASGVGTEKLGSIVLAFGKIKTKGKASMEELNILLEAGVPILDELAKGFGVSKQEIFKMVSTGKVGFEDVSKALKGLTAEGGLFNDLMAKQSKTLFGIFSLIRDNIFQAAVAFGDQLLPQAKNLANVIKSLTGIMVGLSKEVKIAILAVGGLVFVFTGLLTGVAAINFVLPSFIAAWGVVTSILGIVKVAMIGTTVAGSSMNVMLGAATVQTGGLVGALGLLILPLSLLAAGIVFTTIKTIQWTKAVNDATEAQENQASSAQKVQDRMRQGAAVVKEFENVTVSQIQAMDNQIEVAGRLSEGIRGLSTTMANIKNAGAKEEYQAQIDRLKELRMAALEANEAAAEGPKLDKATAKLVEQADKQILQFTNTQEEIKRIELEAFVARLEAAGQFEKAKQLLKVAEEQEDVELERLQEEADRKIELETLTQEELEARENAHLARRLIAKGEFEKANQLLETGRVKKQKELNKQRVAAVSGTFSAIASIGATKSKELAGVIKVANIGQATTDTFAAANRALASAPPPFNFALAAAVTAAGIANVAKIAAVPARHGGVILPTVGGTLVQAAEAGKKEALIPLEDEEAQEALGETLGGTTEININVGAFMGDPAQAKEFAEMIDEELFDLRRNRQSVSD